MDTVAASWPVELAGLSPWPVDLAAPAEWRVPLAAVAVWEGEDTTPVDPVPGTVWTLGDGRTVTTGAGDPIQL